MIFKVLRALTWATIASAVISAVLLAIGDSSAPPRFDTLDAEAARDRGARALHAEPSGAKARQAARPIGSGTPPHQGAASR